MLHSTIICSTLYKTSIYINPKTHKIKAKDLCIAPWFQGDHFVGYLFLHWVNLYRWTFGNISAITYAFYIAAYLDVIFPSVYKKTKNPVEYVNWKQATWARSICLNNVWTTRRRCLCLRLWTKSNLRRFNLYST